MLFFSCWVLITAEVLFFKTFFLSEAMEFEFSSEDLCDLVILKREKAFLFTSSLYKFLKRINEVRKDQ